MISFKGCHHQQAMILQCVRWYVAYSLSYRDLEELMQERGYAVDHSTIQRWVVHYAPRIEGAAYEYPTLIQIIMASLARITSPVTTTSRIARRAQMCNIVVCLS